MSSKLCILPLALLALAPTTACDVDRDRSEVRSHEIVGLSAWEHDGSHYTLLAIDGETRIVATADDDTGVVVVADEDGQPLAAATREPGGARYVELDALLGDGAVTLAATPAQGLDPATAALLDLVVHDELALESFRAGLVADTEPEQLPIGCVIDWVITAIGVAINTPELMMPSLSDWCG